MKLNQEVIEKNIGWMIVLTIVAIPCESFFAPLSIIDWAASAALSPALDRIYVSICFWAETCRNGTLLTTLMLMISSGAMESIV